LLFQMTMPVTLAAALRALPAWPGVGFGILSLALVGGTLPAYLPGGWRPHGLALLLLVLASAAALYLALRLLLHPRPHAAVAATQGVDAGAARAAVDDPAVKDELKIEVGKALLRGVFGSPFVIVDGEPFWGVDRFEQLERWLATGGF